MIDLDSNSLDLITSIIYKCLPPETRIYFFGSRTSGLSKPFSDIDILIDIGHPLSLKQLALLHTEFDASLLPYKVDIVDAYTISEEFKKAINDQLVPYMNK